MVFTKNTPIKLAKPLASSISFLRWNCLNFIMADDSCEYGNALKGFVISAGFDLAAGKSSTSGKPWNKQDKL
jgi:hypothetical protein